DSLGNIDRLLQDLDIENSDRMGLNQSLVPSISISRDTRRRISTPWAQCLIGKVMERTVGFKFLKDRTMSLWKPCGDLQILDLGKDFFPF
ncbi:hypothetical protein MKX01_040374, partial [Papaver californicum]